MGRTKGPSAGGKKKAVVIFAAVVFAILVSSIYYSIHSSLFTVRVVEITGIDDDGPVSLETVNELAAVPVGKASLLSLNLDAIARRVGRHPWIEHVQLEKRPPETLVINVSLRKPKAILQSQADGAMNYVDHTGAVFGPVRLTQSDDFPILSGFAQDEEPVTPLKSQKKPQKTRIQEALDFIDRWDHAGVSHVSQLSAVSFDSEKGFRASVTYPLLKSHAPSRVTLELGEQLFHSDDLTWRAMDANLARVLRYLSEHSIPTHQIFVGDGKKIVVKTARGS